MRNILVMLALASLACWGLANAQCNPDPNEIGIFWSSDCGDCQNCLDFLGDITTAYVVLANITQPGGVGGFEFCLTNADGSTFAPPPMDFIFGYTLPDNGWNAVTPPCFAIGMAAPLPASPCIILLSVDILVFDSESWCFGVKPFEPASIPGQMAYADGIDHGLLIPMNPNTGPGAPDYSMACLNSPDCPPEPVAVEESSWGSLKCFFRK